MANVTIGNFNGDYVITLPGSTYTLAEGNILTGSVTMTESAVEDSFRLDGALQGMCEIDASDVKFHIGENGSVAGEYSGLTFYGDGAHLTNDGIIQGQGGGNPSAVSVFGNEATLVNNGTIEGGIGNVINIEGDRARFTNYGSVVGTGTTDNSFNILEMTGKGDMFVNRGTIDSQHGAIGMDVPEDSIHTFANYGEMHVHTFLNSTTSGTKIIFNNYGKVTADDGINLGEGSDIFRNKGGEIVGTIDGRGGDDLYIVDRRSLDLVEGADGGVDKVKSSASFTLDDNFEDLVLTGKVNLTGHGNALGNHLTGNAGNNKLFGMAGADTLSGGKGVDLLTGGAHADTFIFQSHFGKDAITDFENGTDHINLSHWAGVDDFADLKAHHLTVSGDDLVIHAGTDTLTLHETQKSELDATDFIF